MRERGVPTFVSIGRLNVKAVFHEGAELANLYNGLIHDGYFQKFKNVQARAHIITLKDSANSTEGGVKELFIPLLLFKQHD